MVITSKEIVVPRLAEICAIAITGSGIYSGYSGTWASVTIDGVTYTSSATVEVESGSVITLYVADTQMGVAYIYVDGVTVATTEGEGLGSSRTYDLTVTGSVNIVLEVSAIPEAAAFGGTITVTTL